MSGSVYLIGWKLSKISAIENLKHLKKIYEAFLISPISILFLNIFIEHLLDT